MDAMPNYAIRMTVDEFLNWDPGDGRAWQLVDGEPKAMAPTVRTHGAILGELGRLIGNHLREQRPGCSVIVAPGVVPKFMSDYNMRVPDLAVTCTPYQDEERALSNPVLVVEILSPSNQGETWANVWAYTSIPSVREILVLRADRISAELLGRGADGGWPERPVVPGDDELVLESIGLSVPLRALYATTRLASASGRRPVAS